MNKIKIIFCALVMLLAGAGSSALFACGYCSPLAQDYYVYRISDNYLRKVEVDPAYLPGSNENCLLWMKQLNAETIGPEEVFEIVYKADLDSLASFAEYNAFATILTYNEEALKVLRLAKDCEKARFKVTGDPWYYPVQGDSVRTTLEQIVTRARSYGGGIFESRYFLQEIRAMFTLGRYAEIISRWNEKKDSLPDDILKELTVRYVAGANYNIGEVDKAVDIFLSVGDITSAISCRHLEGQQELEAVVELDVNYPGIRSLLENEIRAICIYGRGVEEWHSERLAEIRALCDKALSLNPDDKALWHYTAAYIDYFNENYPEARKSLKLAEKTVGNDELLAGSVRVLSILTDASSSRHNFFYERRLLRDLKWLDGQIVANLTDEVKERTADGNGWELRSNNSYYYWNDMMRLLTVGILAPAYMEEGKSTRAMEFAMMADNRLLSLTGLTNYDWNDGSYSRTSLTLDQYRGMADTWKLEYSSDFFSIADSVSTNKLIKFANRALKPHGAFDRFIAERSACDADYLNDLIGTKLIRDRRYDEAVKYLSKLPGDFQGRLNTKSYLDDISPCAKLEHANMMADLARRIKNKSNPVEAAQARWEYGQGMMRQYKNQWALAYYFQTEYPPDYVLKANEEGTAIASSLIREGMETMPDPDYAARMFYAMCNFKTVAENYPDTDAAKLVRTWCDTWEDYHREYPDNWN